jgi:hypothetical protein
LEEREEGECQAAEPPTPPLCLVDRSAE